MLDYKNLSYYWTKNKNSSYVILGNYKLIIQHLIQSENRDGRWFCMIEKDSDSESPIHISSIITLSHKLKYLEISKLAGQWFITEYKRLNGYSNDLDIVSKKSSCWRI